MSPPATALAAAPVGAISLEASKLLTAEQLAERWQVPKSQVYRLTREGRLPAVNVGRYYRFRLAAIEAWEMESEASGC
jgi:excisionase family DNA binding protein